MRSRLDGQLKQLQEEMIVMASLCQESLNTFQDAFFQQHLQKGEECIAFEDQIRHKEKEIENLCVKTLLLQQPLAQDLRYVSSCLKAVGDLRRIGQITADMAQISSKMEYGERPEIMDRMFQTISIMFKKAQQAFISQDILLCQDVIQLDDQVDQMFVELKANIVEYIQKTANVSTFPIDALMIGKYFEKIGDHTVSICKWVKYFMGESL